MRILSKSLVAVLCSSLLIAAASVWAARFEDKRTEPRDLAASDSISRLENFLCSPDNPEIVLLGSSLVLDSLFYSDAQYEGLSLPQTLDQTIDLKRHFMRSKHLSRLWQKRFGQSVSAYTLASPGASPADDFIVWQKLLEFGKHPKILVVGIGIQDMCCGSSFLMQSTPVHARLSGLHPLASCLHHPLALVLSFVETCPLTRGAQNFWQVLKWDTSLLNSQLLQRFQLPGATVDKGNPLRSDKTRKMSAPETFQRTIQIWSDIYHSQTKDALPCQLEELSKLAQSAESNRVPLVVLMMPLSTQHKSIIAKELIDQYRKIATFTPAGESLLVINQFDAGGYEDSDFSDSVHLSGRGGDKIYTRLVAALAQNGWSVSLPDKNRTGAGH